MNVASCSSIIISSMVLDSGLNYYESSVFLVSRRSSIVEPDRTSWYTFSASSMAKHLNNDTRRSIMQGVDFESRR